MCISSRRRYKNIWYLCWSTIKSKSALLSYIYKKKYEFIYIHSIYEILYEIYKVKYIEKINKITHNCCKIVVFLFLLINKTIRAYIPIYMQRYHIFPFLFLFIYIFIYTLKIVMSFLTTYTIFTLSLDCFKNTKVKYIRKNLDTYFSKCLMSNFECFSNFGFIYIYLIFLFFYDPVLYFL